MVAMIDTWIISPAKDISVAVVNLFTSDQYQINPDDLRHSSIMHQGNVDWARWYKQPSSLLVPYKSASAVGELKYFVRCVTTTTFPALCYLLGQDFIATEIEDAWKKLPVVKYGKKNRGSHGGWMNKGDKWS